MATKYLTHADYPFEIEEADEELLLHAADLITPEVQDDRQRWRNAAAEIIATKTRKVADLEAALAAKWISVETRLPGDGAEVLFNVPSCYGVEKGRLHNGEWISDRTSPQNDQVSWNNRDGQVTHWQPLPAPPNEKENDG